MINYKSLVYLSILIGLFLASCHNSQQQTIDAAAYHNPLIQPLTDELTKDPDNPQLLYQRSLALIQVEAPDLAKKDLIHALKKDSNNLQYLYTLSQVDLQSGNNAQAIKNLEELVRLSHHAPAIRLALAKAYIKNNQAEPATQNIRDLLKNDSAYPGALFTLAQIQLIKKDTNRAVNILHRSLWLRKDDYPASLLLAECLAAQHNPKAIDIYRETFDMDTSDVTPLLHIGSFYEQQKQIEKAKSIYRECLLKDPDCTIALINTGKILLDQDSVPKALRQFNIAIQTRPNSVEAYTQKGICFERLHQKDSAKTAFAQALVFDPHSEAARKGWQRNRTK
ncbi:MAG TPA: tetratricopeptide repeat protein [Edaphocola sp.]|nr:tetratricopeptide repeat protein [Edaphocola sp.]